MDNSKYDNIDDAFANKHKKKIIDMIMDCAQKHIILLRPLEDKKISIAAHAKDQIMYIFCSLINIVKKIDEDDNIATDIHDNITAGIHDQIMAGLQQGTNSYRIYMFLIGTTNGRSYNSYATIIEEKLVNIISSVIDDENLMQYIAELFIKFMKKFAGKLAGFSWASTKNISSITVNGILRNMDDNNISPEIFSEIYGYSEFRKNTKG